MADTAAPDIPADVSAAEQQETKVVDEQPGIKIFAGGLDFQITSEDLKVLFEQAVAADILSCEVIKRGTRSAGYGFVAVSTDEAAGKAVAELNGKALEELNGKTFKAPRKVVVALAKPAEEKERERSERKVKRRFGRRGSKPVPGEVTEAEANGEAEKPAEAAGAEGEGKPKKKKKSARKFKNKAKAALTPDENGAPAEDATGSAAEDDKGQAARKKRTPKPRRAPGEEPEGERSKTTLFVANLPFSFTDVKLREIFEKENYNVVNAHVVLRRWGRPRRSKGFGFVELGDEADQKSALEKLQNLEVEDGKQGKRQIVLKPAVDVAHDDSEAEGKVEGQKSDEPTGEAVPAAAA